MNYNDKYCVTKEKLYQISQREYPELTLPSCEQMFFKAKDNEWILYYLKSKSTNINGETIPVQDIYIQLNRWKVSGGFFSEDYLFKIKGYVRNGNKIFTLNKVIHDDDIFLATKEDVCQTKILSVSFSVDGKEYPLGTNTDRKINAIYKGEM